MNILIGCEKSQTVCKAFREKGHTAYSCDLMLSSGGYPEWHLCMDVIQAISLMNWDFIGLHPVCTAMAGSGNRTYAKGKKMYSKRVEAVWYTIELWRLACSKANKVYMENPVGAMNGNRILTKPQIIQPYYFGDAKQKTTCLWLFGLPKLIHAKTDNLFEQKTHVGKGEMITYKSGKVMPKWLHDTPSTHSETNRDIRSKTFPGIANAMADQWG